MVVDENTNCWKDFGMSYVGLYDDAGSKNAFYIIKDKKILVTYLHKQVMRIKNSGNS